LPDIRNIADSDLLFSWGRYLYWAELMRRHWDNFLKERGPDAYPTPEWLGVSSYWAASLFVVIEGWKDARFDDPVINAMLELSNYTDVLRKFRNGTFHYQPELVSAKVIDFFRTPYVIWWVHFLHEEFCRWLRDCIDPVGSAAYFSREQTQEFQKNLADLIGWLPLRPAERELESLQKRVIEETEKLDAGGKIEAAEALRASLRKAVEETAATVRQSRRDFLARVGLNPDLVP
jgi:hypothetical protein